MRKIEKIILRNIVANIRYYVSMEHAHFCSNEEENERIKNAVSRYFDTWVGGQADSIEELLELTDGPVDYRLEQLENLTFHN